ncbi:MAG TPA: maleylpyruvate isomerase family mycothiol-dependent enzyme [Egibacteraceae bacterium]|nr:maleylpyruvate isomerase family mycothiol-dependent enzyme [Egibacteraceae bacterium]
MDMPELAAFEDECVACEETLGGVPADAWLRPALGEWTLAELVAHLVRGVTRVDAYLSLDVDASEPQCDRVEYYRETEALAADVAERAKAEAAAVAPAELPGMFADGWRRSAARAGAERPGRLIATLRGPMRLDDYLATRALEVVVHHMDVRTALDLPAAATPEAARLSVQLLEGLLGGPRPRAMGRTRFIMAATGRIPADDPRLPVLR